MPEFKEDTDLDVMPKTGDGGVEDSEIEQKIDNGEAGHVHYNLKRGRIQARKKVANIESANVGEIDVDAVRNDAIGINSVSDTRIEEQKSTTIVDKESNRKSRNNSKRNSSKTPKKVNFKENTFDGKNDKCCCKGGILKRFFKKFFGILGMSCNKNSCHNDQQNGEKVSRSYRHRSHSQRRRRSQNRGIH